MTKRGALLTRGAETEVKAISRRTTTVLSLGILFLWSLVTAGTRAAAAVATDFSHGTLTFTGTDSHDNITISCASGRVQLNGTDISGDVACADVEALVVRGRGGKDQIGVGGITIATFPALSSVRLAGGPGDDGLYGSQVVDRMNGGSGRDIMNGRAGNDILDGGRGRDTVEVSDFSGSLVITDVSLSGGAAIGSDTMSRVEQVTALGDGGYNVVSGAAATIDLQISAGDGGSTLTGGSGDDVLRGVGGNDVISGGPGRDQLEGRTGTNTLSGGPGSDTVHEAVINSNATIADGSLTATGTSTTLSSIERGEIALSATSPVTVDATAFSGPMVIWGSAASDTLLGGHGDDILYPGYGFGNDVIDGNGGHDRMYAYLLGDATLLDGSLVTTDNGTDTFTDVEAVTLDSNMPDITLDASSAKVPTTLVASDRTVLIGGRFDDRLIGGPDSDVLAGNRGDDYLNGKGGVDTCAGGPGRDIIRNCE